MRSPFGLQCDRVREDKVSLVGWQRSVLAFTLSVSEDSIQADCHPSQRQWRVNSFWMSVSYRLLDEAKALLIKMVVHGE